MSVDPVVKSSHVVDIADADPDEVGLLGGKGAGLVAMASQGLPVPPAFVITTEACRAYLENGSTPAGLYADVVAHLRTLEQQAGKTFGAGPHPLLVSVRSGAPVSMPGMMDTILNLGLSREAAIALAVETADTRFMADLVRRFHSMYAGTVLGAVEEPPGVSELVSRIATDAEPGAVFDRVWDHCAAALREETGEEIPLDPQDQLRGAIEAVFSSWNTRRARTYREFHDIPHTLGTAVVVQAMVFGNLDERSGSGVVFTRNPVDGTPTLFGEFLAASQGEDVVSGNFTPDTIDAAEASFPAPFRRLRELCADLERSRGDVLDIEFTVERDQLYFLQVRSAKRTAEAAVRIAHDFLVEGVVGAVQALSGLSIEHVRQIQRPAFDEDEATRAREDGRLLTVGTGACPGQVTGVLCFDSDTAVSLVKDGQDVILARPVTSPADLHGMIASRGIVTATGGSTSHAAVVARALGTSCVVGCSDLDMDPAAGTLVASGRTLRAGDEVSMDGGTGEFFAGTIAVQASTHKTPDLAALLHRCAEASQCEVFARVTLPQHADEARACGADGIVAGLDDILAASGHLDDLVATLLKRSDRVDVDALEEAVARELTPLLGSLHGLDVSLRSIDFLSDDTREYVQQTPLLASYPELSLPLGLPELVRAQLTGLIRAVKASGRTGPVNFAVRHLTDAREAVALGAMWQELRAGDPEVDIQVSSYATSTRSLERAADLEEGAPVAWIELRTLQATHFGLPPRLLLSKEPLDDYVRQGLLDVDPRTEVDPAVARCLDQLGSKDVGVRLSLPITEKMAHQLHGLGFRRFAVELGDVRPVVLALGRAALDPA
ncbi:MAG: Pyruvate, phosphate dikinase [Marmoricola sp.]|nr:Pyruvate, phosphate dikinase [Marmoricola sp.]